MSRTQKHEPRNRFGIRRPKTRKEHKEIRCLKADAAYCEFDISPRNRIMQTQYAV